MKEYLIDEYNPKINHRIQFYYNKNSDTFTHLTCEVHNLQV